MDKHRAYQQYKRARAEYQSIKEKFNHTTALMAVADSELTRTDRALLNHVFSDLVGAHENLLSASDELIESHPNLSDYQNQSIQNANNWSSLI